MQFTRSKRFIASIGVNAFKLLWQLSSTTFVGYVFDQLLLAARKVHVVYLNQLLGAAHYIHFIFIPDTLKKLLSLHRSNGQCDKVQKLESPKILNFFVDDFLSNDKE